MNAPVPTPDGKEIICVVDPMCSWCWGFSPVIDSIAEAYGDDAPVTFMAGGLRPLTAEPMDEALKAEVRSPWEHVGEASGQPFDFTFFERQGFVYDTEPPCRALVAVRRVAPEKARPFLAETHRAFYAEDRDITDAAELADIAESVGVEREKFETAFASREIMSETGADFHRAASMGVRGFPTVILREGEQMAILVAGFTPFDKLKPHLDRWVQEGFPEAPAEA